MAERILKGGEYLVTEVSCDEVFTPEDFSDEQKQIAETTEQFVSNEVLPNIDEIDRQNFDLVVDGLKKCGELGLLMVDVPEEYGGLELDKATSMLVAEKIGAAGSFCTSFMTHTGIGTLPLVYYGTAAQKEKYLEKLMTGEWLAAYCLTEPGAGSDALGASTSATLSEDGRHYILNGTKQFISNGCFADFFTVFARVDKEHFTGFLVERTFEGISIGPEEKKLGIKGSSTTQVILDNAKVPVENLLGEIGKGHKIAFNVLNVGRFKLGSGVTGAAKHALAEGAGYANERKQFGQTISSFGAIKEKLADMAAGVFTAESIIYRLAGLIDKRHATLDPGIDNYYQEYQKGIEEYAAECAMAKVYCTEVLAHVVDEVLQIHGGYGFVSEYPAERFYRDERINRIYEGTNEINRILIPGIVLRKGSQGELPLEEAVKTALSSLEASAVAMCKGLFAAEKGVAEGLKSLCLALIGAAVKKHGKTLSQEQEVLMCLADLAIQVFALESSVLRVEKAWPAASERKRQQLSAVVKVATFVAAQKAVVAARKCLCYLASEADGKALLTGIQRLGNYQPDDLLAAKRTLAEAVSEAEKYPF